MLIFIIILLVCWVYAIAEFGFFLGVGLGWLPSMVIAWIAMQVWSWAVVLVLARGEVGSLQSTSIKTAAPIKNPLKFKKQNVLIPLVLAAVALGSYLLAESELNGSCDALRREKAELEDVKNWFRERGVTDFDELRSASFGALVQKYGSEIARHRHMLSQEADVEWAKYRTRYCFR